MKTKHLPNSSCRCLFRSILAARILDPYAVPSARRERMFPSPSALRAWLALGGLLISMGTVGGSQMESLDKFPVDLVVNAQGESSDSKPSLSVAHDGTTWIAWHAYHRGRDRVLIRRAGPEGLGPVQTVSTEGNVHDPPVVLADDRGSATVFWAARLEGRWRILGRRIEEGKLQPIVTLSPDDCDAIWPSAARIGDGRVAVSWCGWAEGRFRVSARIIEEHKSGEAFALSLDESDSFRSTIARDADGDVWVFWDAYRDGKYAIWGRRVLPELGSAERISPQGANCLQPTAVTVGSRLFVGWLKVADVIGGKGALTQWYTLHAAVRGDDGWRLIRDAEGDDTAAELTHGLIAKMGPKPVSTWGYMGCRRRPMLLADGDGAWMLWERKMDHRGSSPNVTGELIGRKAADGRWQEATVLHQGMLDYRLAEEPRATDNRFFFLASDLPRHGRRTYHRVVGDLGAGKPLAQEDWPGWKPVELPFDDPERPRPEITADGKTYRLYWGDLHCHSGLTADAEGEPDELLHYARDKARLDVVVMTENDHIYDCFLTESEFAVGHFLAGAFTRGGQFLALPGYEWTSRVPKSPDVALGDPQNWDSQRGRGTYPNHRTVIYPPAGGPVVRHPEIGNEIRLLNDAVAAAGGVTLTQHETWDLTGHPVECGVEVTSGWRFYIRDPSHLHDALNRGYRVGLVANGDSHRRCPGLAGALTGIYAESLTAEAVLNAIRNRRVFATNGSRIAVQSWANGSLMGQETRIEAGEDVEISLSAVGTRPVVKATLIRDGREIGSFDGNGTERLSVVHKDRNLSEGTHWYYWWISQEGDSTNYPGNVAVARGNMAWSSPHWVTVPPKWIVDPPVFRPGPKGSFDEVAVKDPSVVSFEDRWHLFYTARGKSQYTTGYVSAESLEELDKAPRHQLKQIRGSGEVYGCAPQVFYFRPQERWYLICQTFDSNYQPVYSTTPTIDRPDSWSKPVPLVAKDDGTKWIDFWVICDESTAYLFYTRGHRDLYAMTTDLGDFPNGFADPRRVFGPVHEAVHIYRAKGLDQYHMFYETRVPGADDLRRWGLAVAEHPLGPWRKMSDEFAVGGQIVYPADTQKWTEEVSHGEVIRTGHDERLEYDPKDVSLLIQGLRISEHQGPYPDLPWRLGIIQRSSP